LGREVTPCAGPRASRRSKEEHFCRCPGASVPGSASQTGGGEETAEGPCRRRSTRPGTAAGSAPTASAVAGRDRPEELAAQAARQQEELRRKQLQEQMAQYRYLGYLNQSGVQKAFLGKGREIYILRQGETLDGKFVVASIEAAAVKILESASKMEAVLKLKKDESSASGT
jgi:hypothetical protein